MTILSIIHLATMTTLQRIIYVLALWPGTDRVISGQSAGSDVDYAFLSRLSLSLSEDVGEQVIRKGSSFAHRYLNMDIWIILPELQQKTYKHFGEKSTANQFAIYLLPLCTIYPFPSKLSGRNSIQ